MNALKLGLVVVGVILLLAGIVFTLQGANVIGGSSVMDNNPTYIYVGVAVAIVGIIVAALGFRSKRVSVPPPASAPAQSSSQ